MKIFKRVVSLTLCAVVLLTFVSCSDNSSKDNLTSSTQASQKVQTTESKEDFVKRVADANLFTNLLKRNKFVSYKTESDYETTTEIYFMFNSEIVRAVDQTIHDGQDEHFIVVEYKGMSIMSHNGGKFCVRAFVDKFGEEENKDAPWYNDYIAYSLIYDNLSLREETDEFYIFENLEDDNEDELYIQCVCYVDKKTLNVVKEVHNNDGYIVEEEFIYNKPTELVNVLDDWNGEMKTVTVVYERYKEGISEKYSKEYEVPYDWEVVPDNHEYESPLFEVYLDEGYTRKYKYPGDGFDYTIYVTTACG